MDLCDTHTFAALDQFCHETCLWNESARSTWQLITVKRQRRDTHSCTISACANDELCAKCSTVMPKSLTLSSTQRTRAHKVQAKTRQKAQGNEKHRNSGFGCTRCAGWSTYSMLNVVCVGTFLFSLSSIYLHMHVAHSINPLIKPDLRWIKCLFFALPSNAQIQSPTVCIVMNSLFNDFGPDVHFPSS